MSNDKALLARYDSLRVKYSDRDRRMGIIYFARRNKLKDILPGVFNSGGPFGDGSVIANRIDVAAQDLAEQISPLPSFKCEQARMVTERDQDKASTRTKIANAYVAHSDLQRQMASGGNWFPTYGFLPGRVEADWDAKMPQIRLVDPRGVYPVYDRIGRLVQVFQKLAMSEIDLCAKFPEFASVIIAPERAMYGMGPSDALVEVVAYHDRHRDVIMLPTRKGAILSDTPNRLKKVMWRIAGRPDIDPEDPRGQFDDVVVPHVMRHALTMMKFEATTKAVRAPIILPNDVDRLPVGPDAIIRSANPQGARRIGFDVPGAAFQQDMQLENEVAKGARHPDVRGGDSPGSIVTGRAVQELQGGFDSQVAAYQGALAKMFEDLVSLCFELDEHLWPSEAKTIRGKAEGAKYNITYTPAKDIQGDNTVEVMYGLSAGMDPNRAMIYGLQGMSAGIFSKDTVRRQMATALDVQEEERKIKAEKMEDTLAMLMDQYIASIPAIAAQGGDVTEQVRAIAEVMQGARAGKPVEDLLFTAMGVLTEKEQAKAEKAAAAEQAADPMAAMAGPGAPGMPGDEPFAGEAGQAPAGRPDMINLLAGLSGSGAPNMQANVQRSMVI